MVAWRTAAGGLVEGAAAFAAAAGVVAVSALDFESVFVAIAVAETFDAVELAVVELALLELAAAAEAAVALLAAVGAAVDVVALVEVAVSTETDSLAATRKIGSALAVPIDSTGSGMSCYWHCCCLRFRQSLAVVVAAVAAADSVVGTARGVTEFRTRAWA